jgi:thiol-disulfide isomerase/thioredoxin
MKAAYLSDKFSSALPYSKYVATGTDEQQRRWKQFFDAVHLADSQKQLISGFTRDMKVLVISGVWCGDCVQQCPFLEHIFATNRQRIDVRFVDRDQNRDLIEQLRINAGDRVPVALFMAEDFELCSVFGDRTLNRYRALARKQLGAACPIGISAPDADETSQTLADWINEFERVQLMLRLSSRLRQKHND